MVKVGVIDSGIDINQIKQKYNYKGIRIFKDETDQLVFSKDKLDDKLNHGTICLEIIRSSYEELTFYIVKVFDQKPITDQQVLVQAIKWCIAQDVHVINISLGIQSSVISDGLIEVCNEAFNKDIAIVAAAHNDHQVCFPAYYPKVFGVGNIKLPDCEFFYAENVPIEFYINGDFSFNGTPYHGSSFACPKITREIIKILAKKGQMKLEDLKEELTQKAKPIQVHPLLIYDDFAYEKMTSFDWEEIYPIVKKHFDQEGKYVGCKKAIVLPLNSRKFCFLQNIEVDGSETVFKILQEEGSFGQNHIPSYLYDKAKRGAFDTVAIGNICSIMSPYNQQDFKSQLADLMREGKKFLVFDRNTFCFLNGIKNEIKVQSFISFLCIDQDTYREFNKFQYLPLLQAPTVAVIGTGNEELISTQIYIRDLLKKQGYKVCYICPSPYGELVGATYSYPLMQEDQIALNGKQRIRFLQLLGRAVQAYHQPDIIISGVYNKLSPSNLASTEDYSECLNFLHGIQPDALIVVINAHDRYEDILENIQIAKAFSRASILFFISNKKEDDQKLQELLQKEALVISADDPEMDHLIRDKIQQYFTNN
jgi:hypothetical protein